MAAGTQCTSRPHVHPRRLSHSAPSISSPRRLQAFWILWMPFTTPTRPGSSRSTLGSFTRTSTTFRPITMVRRRLLGLASSGLLTSTAAGKGPPSPGIGDAAAPPFNNGPFQGRPRSSGPLIHSGGIVSLGLEDTPSLVTGLPTTATHTSEAGWASYRQGATRPLDPMQERSWLVTPGSKTSYPSGAVGRSNTPDYETPVHNACPPLPPPPPDDTISGMEGYGQEAQSQTAPSEHVPFAFCGDAGKGVHSCALNAPLSAYPEPAVPSAVNNSAFFEAAYFNHDPAPSRSSYSGDFTSQLYNGGTMFESDGRDDLFALGTWIPQPGPPGGFTPQHHVEDVGRGKVEYIPSQPPVDQQLRSLPQWGGSQSEATQTRYRNIMPAPPAPGHGGAVGVFEQASEAVLALPLPTSGRARIRAGTCPSSGTQHSVKRRDRESQHRHNHSAILNSPSPGRQPAGAKSGQSVPKERGKRNGELRPGQGKAVQKKKDDRSVCINCRYSKSTV